MENYADRKRGFDLGPYRSSVREQTTPCVKPMAAARKRQPCRTRTRSWRPSNTLLRWNEGIRSFAVIWLRFWRLRINYTAPFLAGGLLRFTVTERGSEAIQLPEGRGIASKPWGSKPWC